MLEYGEAAAVAVELLAGCSTVSEPGSGELLPPCGAAGGAGSAGGGKGGPRPGDDPAAAAASVLVLTPL